MSTFTPITANMDWQDVGFINALVAAYSERRQACMVSWSEGVGPNYASAVDLFAAGDDIQAVSFWHDMQDWLEANCVNFVNHTLTLAGAEVTRRTGPALIQVEGASFTLAAWRTVAGLNANGFRRATVWEPDPTSPDWTVDPEFSYGPMQAGDIIGPWIFDDLQKAIDVLRWTLRFDYTGVLNSTATAQRNVMWNNQSTWADAYDGVVADWPGSGWERTWGYIYEAYAWGRRYADYWWRYTAGAYRTRGAAQVGNVPTFCSCSTDVYLLPEWAEDAQNAFLDMDTLGMAKNKLWFSETLAEADDATRTAAMIGNISDDPLVLSGITGADVTPPPNAKFIQKGVSASGVMVLKWDGTNGFEWKL